jgi:outer membrane protein assembly factor BamE (lipoprotein component of BamABCDE complex)
MEASKKGWRRLSAACGIAGLMLLAGCDPQRVEKLEEGVATEAQVRQQFGEPANIVVQPDGSRAFEYPRQPEGWTNYLITIGPDGKMSALRQLLNEDNFARVQTGLSGMQVRQMLGRPALQQHFDLKNEDVLSWRFKQHGQESKLFSATFVSGKLTSTAIADDPRDAGR